MNIRHAAWILWAVTAPAWTAGINAVAVGHEYRQDDFPSIARARDGSVWVAWLSFAGDRDDIGLRRFDGNRWSALQWVPNTSGDSSLPQLATDASSRVWLVWSQQVAGNWDLYARCFDPAKQSWGPLERLTTAAGPDINPRLASDGQGRLALAWQSFRGRNSNIYLKTFDGAKWSAEVRVTKTAGNDWEPAVALDGTGTVWIAYDSYRNGNYDVFLAKVRGGAVEGPEMPVAVSSRFEARATIAVDTADRVWVAWETGQHQWGKDQGYILRGNPRGAVLGGPREPRIRCLEAGQWREPAKLLASAFRAAPTSQPHVFSDGKGSIWVVAKTRLQAPGEAQNRGYWEYYATHYGGDGWSQTVALPNSRGRSSTRASAAADGGALWLAWDTDNRSDAMSHRPLRQQVYAARLDPAPAPSALVWGQPPVDPPSRFAAGHANEAAGIRALRAHTVLLDGKPHRIVRGDFHRHTELSWDGGGGGDGSLQDFYRYMIDAAAMDFGASTDHQGGAWPYWWWYTQKLADMYHAPGAYVPIFGYERSALFPNGHRNMFFARRSDSRVTPFFLRTDAKQFGLPRTPMGDEPGIGAGDLLDNDTRLLYEEIRGRNAIAISHTSGTRMGTDWRDNDPRLEPVVEIFQGCRTNYEAAGAPHAADPKKDAQHIERAGFQTEGWVANAWAKGYKLGIIASSDHGSTHISYALVYTDNPTRQGILDAIRKRHTYGATDNILLDVRMGGHFMGDEFALDQAQPVRVKARGTRAVAKVDIIKDNKVVYSTSPAKQDVQFEFTDTGEVKGRHFYYVRLQQDDGMVAWSSPFFVNYR